MKTALSLTHYIAAGVIAGAFTIGFLSGPALAEEMKVKSDSFQFQFAYDKAELGSTETASKMLTRLEGEVRKFCKNPVKTGTRLRNVDTSCVTDTMQQTVNGFGSSVVAEVYKNKGRADG